MLENNNRDKYFMEKALAEANRAARRGRCRLVLFWLKVIKL